MVAKLCYVLFEGEPRHVSTFPRGKSSVVLCPLCRERVDLVRPSRRVHHARHRPGSACAIARGESALHENVKLHIASQLQRRAGKGKRGWTGILLGERCSCCSSGLRPRFHYVSWDEVKIEASVGERRPDVLLLDAGVPVLAVEVFASHAVSAEKRTYYEDRGLECVEVTADEALLGGTGWTTAEPLPVTPRIAWTCERCKERKARRLLATEKVGHVAALRLLGRVGSSTPRPVVWRRLLDSLLGDRNDCQSSGLVAHDVVAVEFGGRDRSRREVFAVACRHVDGAKVGWQIVGWSSPDLPCFSAPVPAHAEHRLVESERVFRQIADGAPYSVGEWMPAEVGVRSDEYWDAGLLSEWGEILSRLRGAVGGHVALAFFNYEVRSPSSIPK